MTPPDFTNLPLEQLLGVMLLLAALDTLSAVALAIIRKEFSPSYVTAYLGSHVLRIIFPIFALGVIGHGIPQLGVPAIAYAGLAASASLAAYAVKVVASILENFKETTPA